MTDSLLPTYRDIEVPLLAELLARGGSIRPSDVDGRGRSVYDALAQHFALSKAALALSVYEKDGSARSKWQNMVRFARDSLRKAGFIDGSQYGVWAVTDAGKSFLRSAYSDHAGRGRVSENYELTPSALSEFQKAAAQVGAAGELIVLTYEHQRLTLAGRGDLAAALEHVALTNVAAGYDIKSFEASGTPRYIEVKSTSQAYATFFLSSNELAVATKLAEDYHVYRVSGVGTIDPEVVVIPNLAAVIASGALLLVPTQYAVSEAASAPDA